MDDALIDDYAETIMSWISSAPIVVFRDANGSTTTRYVADGFHRVEAMRKIGAYEIPAVVHDGTRRDALLHALGANKAHGLRRTNADKRRAVETLLCDEEWCQWSDRMIAAKAGVSDKTVAAVRRERSNWGISAVEARPENRIGADGKARAIPQSQPAAAPKERTPTPEDRQNTPAFDDVAGDAALLHAPIVDPVHGDDLDAVRATTARLQEQTNPVDQAPAPKGPTAQDAMHAAHGVTAALGGLARVADALLESDARTLISELRKALARLVERFETKEGGEHA